MDFYHSRTERSSLGVHMIDIEVSLRSLICEDKNLNRNTEVEQKDRFRTETNLAILVLYILKNP